MKNTYRVGYLDNPGNDDPTFPEFYQALKYTEDEDVKHMDAVYAIWENDHPVVILFMYDIFTNDDWTWPVQPEGMGQLAESVPSDQMNLL